MTENTKNQRIAYSLVSKVSNIGMSKEQAKKEHFKGIRSIGTQRNYLDRIKEFLDWRDGFGLTSGKGFLAEEMQAYLYDLVEDPRPQAFINMTRQALQITFKVTLAQVESEIPTILSVRAYTEEQVAEIVKTQSPRHAFSTALSYGANLRAHELLTLRRAEELAPSAHRPWRADLFASIREHVLYSCTGKGGLDRHVAIPNELVEKLETFRLPKGKELHYTDRKIRYKCFYDLSGGQAFSQAFTSASQKALGFSEGVHGLRHSYAQKRLATLKANGFDTQTSLLILSQELGHFRPEIVLAYLR